MKKISINPVLAAEPFPLLAGTGTEADPFVATQAGQTFTGTDGQIDFVSYANWNGGNYLRATLNPARNGNDTGWATGATYVSIEGLIGSVTAYNRLTGNDDGNKLIGGNLTDTLNGGLGADTLVGGGGIDYATYENAAAGVVVNLGDTSQNDGEAEGDVYQSIEAVYGSEHSDVLIGDNANNTLEGGGGDDFFIGGLGADSIVGGEGVDMVSYFNATTGFSLTLGGMGLSWYGAQNRQGSALGDSLTMVEDVTGSDYDDLVLGTTGSNAFFAGKGNDFFDGHGGEDYFEGGEGIDTVSYKFDEAGGLEIVLGEGEDEGTAQQTVNNVTETDTLLHVENVTGSKFADQITGNSGANVLDGYLGADEMAGNDGNDIYYVDHAGDKTFEDNAAPAGGIDSVYTTVSHGLSVNVENLYALGAASISLYGNALHNVINGNGGSNRINGGSGNDTINGMAGSDVLTGSTGYDTFIFSLKPSSSNREKITDFSKTFDTIKLENSAFTGLKTGNLSSSAFYATRKKVVEAHDKSDRIIYDLKSGKLYFDRDGSKDKYDKVHFATLTNEAVISAGDFIII